MSAADDRERIERDRYVRRVLDVCGMSHMLDYLRDPRHLPTDVRAYLPQPPRVRPAPDPPVPTIIESTITLSVQRWGAQPLVDMSDQDIDKAIQAKVNEMLLSGPAPSRWMPSPNANPATLTLEDLQRAYGTLSNPQYGNWSPPPGTPLTLDDLAGGTINAMDPYGASPFAPQPMPPGFSQGIWSGPGHDTRFPNVRQKPRPTDVSGCRERGCTVVSEYRPDLRAWEFTHGDFHMLLEDRAVAQAPFKDYAAQRFIEWARSIHRGLDDHTLCGLCGQERDPDVEPVTLELPPGGPNPDYVYANNGSIEACSAACATAYAMRIDLAREHPGPRTQRQRDQIDYEEELAHNRVVLASNKGVTDSKRRSQKRLHNPWSDQDAA